MNPLSLMGHRAVSGHSDGLCLPPAFPQASLRIRGRVEETLSVLVRLEESAVLQCVASRVSRKHLLKRRVGVVGTLITLAKAQWLIHGHLTDVGLAGFELNLSFISHPKL